MPSCRREGAAPWWSIHHGRATAAGELNWMEKPIVAAAADDERETGAGNNMAETILSPPHLEGRIQSQCFLGSPRDINESGNCPIRFLSATGEEKPSTNKREILFCADRRWLWSLQMSPATAGSILLGMVKRDGDEEMYIKHWINVSFRLRLSPAWKTTAPKRFRTTRPGYYSIISFSSSAPVADASPAGRVQGGVTRVPQSYME